MNVGKRLQLQADSANYGYRKAMKEVDDMIKCRRGRTLQDIEDWVHERRFAGVKFPLAELHTVAEGVR